MTDLTLGRDAPYTMQYRRRPVLLMLRFCQYENGRVAVQMIDWKDGSSWGCATVNLPEEPMEADEVAIKTWSENQDVLPFLVANKIVAEPHREVRAGYATAQICRLLVSSAQQEKHPYQ